MIFFVDFMQSSPAHSPQNPTDSESDPERSPILFSDSDHEDHQPSVTPTDIHIDPTHTPSASGWQHDGKELRRQFPLLFSEPSQV